MQKGLCIIALAVSAVIFVLFLADLILGLANQETLAPFKYFSLIADIVFVICSGITAVMSFFTLREQV